MSAASLLKYLYLARLSRPKADRILYRAIRRNRVRKIVELGMGCGLRAVRMISIAQRYCEDGRARYTGIDLFETPGGPSDRLSLKEAYRLLRSTDARVQLVPGDPFGALMRAANTLGGSDLVVIGADQDRKSLARAWFYLPRMLHERSLVLLEEKLPGAELTCWRMVSRAEIQQLSGSNSSRQRAA